MREKNARFIDYSFPLSCLSPSVLVLRCQNLVHVDVTIFAHLKEFVVLVDSMAKVVQHVHLDILQLRNLVTHLTNLILLVLSSLVLLLLQLHRLKLLVEELGLFQTALLLTDYLG